MTANGAFKPSQVAIDAHFPPLVATLNNSEAEIAATLMVRVLQVHGDAWGPVTAKLVGEVWRDDAAKNVHPLASIDRNPFCRPDFHRLVNDGFARWCEDRGGGTGEPIEFTEAGIERLRRWARP